MGSRSGVTTYDLDERLAFSKARCQETDLDTLRLMFPIATNIRKTSLAQDKAGVDYVVTLRRGAEMTVDAKTRDEGCSKFWACANSRRPIRFCNRCLGACDPLPEVALEIWNVMPGGVYSTPERDGKVGWTLDEAKNVDLILYTFAPADHAFAYARPLALLREAFRRNFAGWQHQYKTDVQKSERRTPDGFLRWESKCLFAPLAVVDSAIASVSRARLVPIGEGHDERT
jgi:hypothetical protein